MDLSPISNSDSETSIGATRKFRRLRLCDTLEETEALSQQEENQQDKGAEDTLSQFVFKKMDANQRVTRSTARKMQTEPSLQNSSEKSQPLPEIEEADEEENDGVKKKVKAAKKKKKEGENMPPPKSDTKAVVKRSSNPSDNKKVKDEMKERQLEDITQYLWNYLKEPQANTINKTSLKRCLRGLLIDNITEAQADLMLNYPNLDEKNITKDFLSYEDLKALLRECNFKLDTDGNLI